MEGRASSEAEAIAGGGASGCGGGGDGSGGGGDGQGGDGCGGDGSGGEGGDGCGGGGDGGGGRGGGEGGSTISKPHRLILLPLRLRGSHAGYTPPHGALSQSSICGMPPH
jgi:hypothetical protein